MLIFVFAVLILNVISFASGALQAHNSKDDSGLLFFLTFIILNLAGVCFTVYEYLVN
jgi:hypothetical protein